MAGLATLLQSSSLNYLKPHRQELLHLWICMYWMCHGKKS